MDLKCKTPADVLKAAKDHKVKMVDVKFVDMPGMWQHFTVPLHELEVDSFTDGYGFDGSSIRGYQDINESDISNLGGHYLLVPQGSCHSRVMMINSESDFEQLRAFNKSKNIMHNAQKDIFKEKIQLINDMNAVVDQAKFLNEVRKYWIDLDDCVNFDADEIGTAVSIISDDTKQRLLDSAKLRQAQRDIVAVVKTPKEKEYA